MVSKETLRHHCPRRKGLYTTIVVQGVSGLRFFGKDRFHDFFFRMRSICNAFFHSYDCFFRFLGMLFLLIHHRLFLLSYAIRTRGSTTAYKISVIKFPIRVSAAINTR